MRKLLTSVGTAGTLTISLAVSIVAAGCSSESGEPAPSAGGSVSGGGAAAGGSAAGTAPGGTGQSAAGTSSGSSAGGVSGGGGSAGGAAGGAAGGTAGTGGAGGVAGSGGTGGSTGGTGGSGGTAGGSGGGTAGGGGGTGGGGAACTPNPSGAFVVNGDVILDPKTCLTWTKATTGGQPYAEAEAHCTALSLGGFDDWRLPTAGEVVSIFKCNDTYPPVAEVFTVSGDGIWTTTLSGTIAGDQPKVCGAGQASGQYYDFGKVGGQNTRCVRGAITLPDRTDCKTNTKICPN